jgi:selenocysteine lyase/cysteine desulfurase
MNRSRRHFLTSLASVGALAPLARRLEAVEADFSRALQEVGSGPPPAYLKDRYMLDANITYLNHASIGTMPRAVHDAHVEYSAICESNPHLYIWGGAWDTLLGDVRMKAGRVLGADPEAVSITHNATEGFNTLAHGLPLGPGDEVLFTNLNHGGASIPWQNAAVARGFTVRRFDLPLNELSSMSAEDLVSLHRKAISPATRVLVFPHVDNIIGLRHPMAALTGMAREMGVEFVAADGAQAVGMIPVDVQEAGIDFYSASAHKWIQAPKGLGVFFTRPELRENLRPMWVRHGLQQSAGTPHMYEDYGTRNSPEVMSLGDAMDFQDALGAAEKDIRYRRVRAEIKARVDASPTLHWNSPQHWKNGSAIVSIGFDFLSANELSAALYSEKGIVLRAFQSDDFNALRISPNMMTTDDEVDLLFEELEARA